MTFQSVVLYRNLNLGHRGSPDKQLLEGALLGAGATQVRSFQTNGTVLIAGDHPTLIVESAAALLRNDARYDDHAFVRSVDSLRQIVHAECFAGDGDERTYRKTATFVEDASALTVQLPWTNARDDLDLLEIQPGVVLGQIRKRNATAGNPTAEIERMLGVKATTRTVGTIERLIKAASR